MSILSRRNALFASVSILAIGGAYLYGAQSGSGTTTLEFFDNKDKPDISFLQVKKTVDPYIESLITRSEKDFGVKYTESDRERIRTRVWDRFRLAFSEVYNNQDDKVLNRDDRR